MSVIVAMGIAVVFSMVTVQPAQAVGRPAACWQGANPSLCVKYNRSDTERVYRSIVVIGGGYVATAELCGTVPHIAFKAACKAAIYITYGRLGQAVKRAHDQKRCLEVEVSIPMNPWYGLEPRVVNC